MAIAAPRTATVVRVAVAQVATERPRSPAVGPPPAASPRPPRPLVGLLLLVLISLLEGWAALRLLFRQIRAIWWAPVPVVEAGPLPLRSAPSPGGLVGVAGEACGESLGLTSPIQVAEGGGHATWKRRVGHTPMALADDAQA